MVWVPPSMSASKRLFSSPIRSRAICRWAEGSPLWPQKKCSTCSWSPCSTANHNNQIATMRLLRLSSLGTCTIKESKVSSIKCKKWPPWSKSTTLSASKPESAPISSSSTRYGLYQPLPAKAKQLARLKIRLICAISAHQPLLSSRSSWMINIARWNKERLASSRLWLRSIALN